MSESEMLEATEKVAHEAGKGSAETRQPDREDVVLGLSPSGFHRLAYADWGPIDDKRPIICVHGLTRQGRDFDHLAARLVAAGRRVVCPDLPGRGRSGWISNPDHYGLPQYCADMNALIARLGVSDVDWVGTSLGGLIGMIMAGCSGSIVRKLVINDIGPFVTSTGLRRIGQYIGKMPSLLKTIEEAETYFRTVLAPYGKLADLHWRHLTEHSVHWDDTRQGYVLLYDPAIAKGFRLPWFQPLDLWAYWEAIRCPVLLLRGKHSDLLSFDLVVEMRKRNAMVNAFQFDDCGHVPPLMATDQIDVVAQFLLKKSISGLGEN
jgi:pimeloyl-ACP methyl ester carboxylesterase